MPEKRAAPVPGKPTTYRGLNDMAGWWAWSEEAEMPSIESYRPFIRPWDLVFDIGANRGRKTWIFRQLGAKVVAVEPLLAFGDEFVPEFWWKWREDVGIDTQVVLQHPQVVAPVGPDVRHPGGEVKDYRILESLG